MAYSEEEKQKIIAKVLDRITDGESLRAICKTKGMPDRVSLIGWMNDEQFTTITARARDLQADAKLDEINEVTQEIRSGTLEPNAGRTVIWSLQWQASKLRPKKYGEKITQEVSGRDGAAIEVKDVSDIKTKLLRAIPHEQLEAILAGNNDSGPNS